MCVRACAATCVRRAPFADPSCCETRRAHPAPTVLGGCCTCYTCVMCHVHDTCDQNSSWCRPRTPAAPTPTHPPSQSPMALQTGMLYNTEGGSPMVPIGEQDLPSPILVGAMGLGKR